MVVIPAYEPGSVVHERGKREAGTAFSGMKGFHVIAFPRERIPHRGAG